MAEEATTEAPAIEQDTPETAVTPDTPEVDYRKRYEDLQPEYTRATQKLSDEQQLLQHISEKFPHLIAEEEPDDEDDDLDTYQDPEPPANADLEELKAWRADRDAERAQEAFDNDFKEAVGDREISATARSFIENRTVALGNNAEALTKAVDEWFEATTASAKPKPRVPSTPTGGGAPDDFDSSKADLDQMMARARELASNTSTD